MNSGLRNPKTQKFREIPPTGEWVDRSSPAYKRPRLDFFESHPLSWVGFGEEVGQLSLVRT